jgi:hypothetical protein
MPSLADEASYLVEVFPGIDQEMPLTVFCIITVNQSHAEF